VIPPADLVNKFDTFCQSVFDTIFANGLENEQLSTVRDALLPQLMSGEIDVSDIDL
jgi:type I restriction enzyme S subunit